MTAEPSYLIIEEKDGEPYYDHVPPAARPVGNLEWR